MAKSTIEAISGGGHLGGIQFAGPSSLRAVIRGTIIAAGLGTALPVSSAAFAQRAASSELPGGWGNAVQGVFIFAAKCSGCHSERDSKTTAKDMETCWHDPKVMFNFV